MPSPVVDPPPPDPLPPDIDPIPMDPVPIDETRVAPPPPDPPPPDYQPPEPVDPPPPDPPPPDYQPPRRQPPPPDPAPPPPDPLPSPRPKSIKSLDLIDQWRETSARDVMRTQDLPLYDPPRVILRSERLDDAISVRLRGAPRHVTLRWQTRGELTGEGRDVRWIPEDDRDQLRVAVRSRGGVAVTSVRARDVPER